MLAKPHDCVLSLPGGSVQSPAITLKVINMTVLFCQPGSTSMAAQRPWVKDGKPNTVGGRGFNPSGTGLSIRHGGVTQSEQCSAWPAVSCVCVSALLRGAPDLLPPVCRRAHQLLWSAQCSNPLWKLARQL